MRDRTLTLCLVGIGAAVLAILLFQATYGYGREAQSLAETVRMLSYALLLGGTGLLVGGIVTNRR